MLASGRVCAGRKRRIASGRSSRSSPPSRGSRSILVAEHGGEVPADIEALERLPGVGHKTASVVMVQAFDVPAFPVDTHIHRLAGRWGLSRARNVDEVERDLKKLYPPECWRDLHIQIILFGREYCPARGHDLTACPICSWAASQRRIRDEMRTHGAKRKPSAAAP